MLWGVLRLLPKHVQWNSSTTAPLKSGHSSTMAKFLLQWHILILLLPSRAATPEFPTMDSKNDQITASNNSLKFKITKKPTEKAVYSVQFANVKTYWKQRFNYEIKLHGGLDNIHGDIYHWYALYCRSIHLFIGLKDRGADCRLCIN